MSDTPEAAASSTTRETGTGAPKDAPGDAGTGKRYSDDEVNAFVAKERRKAQQSAIEQFRSKLGVESDEEIAELVEAGRKTRPRKQDDAERLAEKVRAQAETEKAALQQQIATLRAANEASMVRDAVMKSLSSVHLVDGGADLILASLGIGATPAHRLVVKDGAVTVVDADGDPAGKTVESFLAEQVKSRPYLQAPTSTQVRSSPPEQKRSAPPQGRQTIQQQIDAAITAGMAHATGVKQ